VCAVAHRAGDFANFFAIHRGDHMSALEFALAAPGVNVHSDFRFSKEHNVTDYITA
jgi:hypothetical protein